MKYLVELNSSNVPADYILSELHLEFGRALESTGDADILKLQVDTGAVSVLCDYDNNRVWISIDMPTGENYQSITQRIEHLLDNSRDRGYIEWSQIEIDS
ncbi:MAG: hypothetical protein ACLFTK_02825 [Anaerolineales bacterium]